MSSEIDVTNLLHRIHSNTFFSKKVQNWGLRPTSTDKYTQHIPFLLFHLCVRSCVVLQSSNFHDFLLVLKNTIHFWMAKIWSLEWYFEFCSKRPDFVLDFAPDWILWVNILYHMSFSNNIYIIQLWCIYLETLSPTLSFTVHHRRRKK